MNHYFATYVDFIQSVGFTMIFLITTFVVRKLLLDAKQDNYIEVVKIRVED